MESGYLKKYFKGIVVKKLTQVEIMPQKSNQHEFNARRGMREIFGDDNRTYKTTFMYISGEENISEDEFLTWYDSRRNNPDRSAEYRMYYPSTSVSEKAQVGDSLFICMKQDGTVLCIISEKDATITSQLYWLFDLDADKADRFIQNVDLDTDGDQLDFAVRIILDQIGVEYEEADDEGLLEDLLIQFNGSFPKTDIFSAYARKLAKFSDPVNEPDRTLMSWYSKEEKIFFLLEKHIIEERLKTGFYSEGDVDVEGFIKFSLSVQNRRKSRAGLSLENHISALFDANKIQYSHTPVTENRSKPDFLFPNIECYRNPDFPREYLSMLGAKSTCKDRWRQVLAEADRIEKKHLLTLEAAISTYQTDEMQDKHLQLVVPLSIHKTYTENQQKWLYSVKDFIDEIQEKQKYYYDYVVKF